MPIRIVAKLLPFRPVVEIEDKYAAILSDIVSFHEHSRNKNIECDVSVYKRN